ncbi:MAG: hypothetical protein IIA40_00800 [SAR324 cluster bacterium]|nr:hypothetical protein [SAR324 cluster bacterium]
MNRNNCGWLGIFIIPGLLFLMGCAASINKPRIQAVKSAAVVLFTVPRQIEFRDDSKESRQTILQALAQAVTSGDGARAATLSHQTFTETLRKQALPFNVLTVAETRGVPAFSALYRPPETTKEEKEEESEPVFKLSFEMGPAPGVHSGAAPDGFNSYGLVQNWSSWNPLVGSEEEAKYILAVIKALNVDAIIAIADPGYSFVCDICSGGNTGTASTGSRFMGAMVDREGEVILKMQAMFSSTDEEGAMLAGAVNPMAHDELFTEHGRKMAVLFANSFHKAMKKK